jgi:hypothetical protein
MLDNDTMSLHPGDFHYIITVTEYVASILVPQYTLLLGPALFFLYLGIPPFSFTMANKMSEAASHRFYCHNSLQVHLYVLSVGVSRCRSNYARVLSVAR